MSHAGRATGRLGVPQTKEALAEIGRKAVMQRESISKSAPHCWLLEQQEGSSFVHFACFPAVFSLEPSAYAGVHDF